MTEEENMTNRDLIKINHDEILRNQHLLNTLLERMERLEKLMILLLSLKKDLKEKSDNEPINPMILYLLMEIQKLGKKDDKTKLKSPEMNIDSFFLMKILYESLSDRGKKESEEEIKRVTDINIHDLFKAFEE